MPAAEGSVYTPGSLEEEHRAAVHVWAWGRGDLGQLGNGTETNAWVPQRLESLEGKNVVYNGCNVFHSIFLTGDGEVFTCGSNDSGQLGCRGKQTAVDPTRVDALDTHRIIAAACGQSHTLAVTDQGALASWGSTEWGQLGQGMEGLEQPQPKIIRNTREAHFARVAGGASHTLALTRSGQVHSCGGGTFGALGHGDEESHSSLLHLRSLWSLGVVQVACGESHSCALTCGGEVYTWGRGKYGQLGHGNFQNVMAPAVVVALRGVVGVQVACGADHTLAVGAGGEVYSWGHGGWGQTGLGSADHTCRPGRIQALEGERVVQVAAGSRHSMALTASNRVFAWGQGEEGQLGGGPTPLPQLSPRLVDGLPTLPVLFVSAGGDCCFVAVQELPPGGSPIPVGPRAARPHGRSLLPLQLPPLRRMAAALAAAPPPTEGQPDGARQRAVAALVGAVDDVFTSPGFLMHTFQLQPTNQPEPGAAPPPPHGLDLQAAMDTYRDLLRSYSPEVVAALANACTKVLEQLERSMRPTRQGSEQQWLRALLVLLLNPLHNDPAKGAALLSRCASIVHHLPADCQQTLVEWFSSLSAEVLGGGIVRPLQTALGHAIESGGALARSPADVLRCVQLLQLLHRGNQLGGERLSYTEFYSKPLSTHASLRDEYIKWRHLLLHQQQHKLPAGQAQPDTANLVSLCQAPFLLTPEAKSKILQGEMMMAKQEEVQSSALGAMFQGLHPAMAAYLELHVRRDHLLQDTLHQLANRQPNDLKKPLRIKFMSNGVAEEGLDEGGVSREFFQLLVAEVFREEYGMFTHSAETRCFWFNAASFEAHSEFLMVGMLLGLALYNSVILDIHFPQVVYKKLLHQEPTFADLRDLSPELGRGLQQLLDFQGDVEGTFCRTFEVQYEFFGELRTVELIPGGSQVPVTEANRQQYVDAYTRWALVDSVADQFKAFSNGFHQVCAGPALTMLRHEELELLLCGLPHLDFQKLQSIARYEGGFHPTHPTVQHFWQVLHSLTLEQKKRFLSFTTGCDRAPVGGLGTLVLTIQRSGPDCDRLPSAHTCFNVLLLPDYSSRGKLRDRLLLAIDNAQGFGLQ